MGLKEERLARFRSLETGAKNGIIECQDALGDFYRFGGLDGMDEDAVNAAKWYGDSLFCR